jgi:HAD superfamily hydrolase (TIGR01509 family)
LFIIFDLDDTLIDTSRSVTPLLLDRILQRAQREGLLFDQEARVKLLEGHLQYRSSEEALTSFLEEHGASPQLVAELKLQYRNAMDEKVDVPPLPYALELISLLLKHRLAIVTLGEERIQYDKLKKAGFFPENFSKIVATAGQSKKELYQILLEQYAHLPSETVVIGDRIAIDLLPAKQLGCHTVRILNGRGAREVDQEMIVDWTIFHLKDLLQIIKGLEKYGRK